MTSEKPIIFFDSTCLMCNTTVQNLLKLDTAGKLSYAPLMGETWKSFFGDKHPEKDAIILIDKDGVTDSSTAIIKVLKTLGGAWNIPAFMGKVIPQKLRDGVYKYIAKNRYKWFGQVDHCIIPTAEQRGRFLL